MRDILSNLLGYEIYPQGTMELGKNVLKKYKLFIAWPFLSFIWEVEDFFETLKF